MLYQHTKQTARGNVNKATVVCTSSRDSTTSSRDSTWTLDVHVLQAAAMDRVAVKSKLPRTVFTAWR